ncbi:MAG: hypothetical protein Q8O88_05315 [bacterium]|nr:hypothetical protein [bacterium]
MPKDEPTTTDILEVLHDFSSNMDKRFNKIDERFDKVDERFDKVDKRFDKVENNIKIIKSTMVTKDYLDEKLGDLRGDLTVLIRKEDNKVKELVNILVKKKVMSKTEQEKLFKMEPFAQTFI